MGDANGVRPLSVPPLPSQGLARLLESCRAATELSRQVHAGLVGGTGAGSLIPLLQREADLTAAIQQDVHALGDSLPGDAAGAHAELVEQMAALARLEEENHQLLRRRGVRLAAGPTIRHRTGRTRPLGPVSDD